VHITFRDIFLFRGNLKVKRKVKRNISFMLATSLIVTTAAGNAILAANDKLYDNVNVLEDSVTAEQVLTVNVEDSVENQIKYEEGKEFVVDFNLSNNQGINSYTMYIEYDPSVIQPVDIVPMENIDDYVNYTGVDEATGTELKKPVFNLSKFKTQLSLAPTTDNEDYKDLEADGNKTAAELGRIKYAYMVEDSNEDKLVEAVNDGTLFKMKFKVIGKGTSSIEVKPVGEGFNATPSDYSKLYTAYNSASVSIVDEVITESTETTTDETTETTTQNVPTPPTPDETTETTTISQDKLHALTKIRGGDNVKLDGDNAQVLVGEEETFLVDFKVENNGRDYKDGKKFGINSYTIYIEYDPEIVECVGVEPVDLDSGNYLTYDSLDSSGGLATKPLVNIGHLENQINLKPKADNEDYADLAVDGSKTAAQLGRIKYAYYIEDSDSDGNLIQAEKQEGILFTMQFKAKKAGDANLILRTGKNDKGETIQAFTPAPTLDASYDTAFINASVKAVDTFSSDDTTETTTEVTTEETTTETTTQSVPTPPEPDETTETTTENIPTPPGPDETTETTTESIPTPPGPDETTETTTEAPPSPETPAEKSQVLRIDADKEEVTAGDEFVVDFKLNGNAGVNSYNMYIEYDPSIIQAVGVVPVEAENINDYVSYAGTKTIFDSVELGNQITMKPSANDSDYADLEADGVKTAAELGRIKYAYTITETDDNGNLIEAENDGTLFKIKFKALKSGTGSVSARIDNSGNPMFRPSPADKTTINTNVKKASILIAEKGVETDEITFKDEDFGNEIKNILGKSVIIKSDAEAIEELIIEEKDISSISDLKYFPNIKTLKLKENIIKNIDSIAELTKVETIDLSDNVIRDISALSKLENIKELDISDNRVKSLSDLKGLSSITTLKAASNYITSLDGIEGLTNITELDLSNNDITDISALAGLTSLVTLNLEETEVKDISILESLPNLKYVNLKDTNVSGNTEAESVVARLRDKGITVDAQITTITVNSSVIKDIIVDILQDLGIEVDDSGKIPKNQAKQIKKITIENKGIDDIKDLESFTEVKEINLSRNKIEDISVIKNMKKLKKIDLKNNNIKDISVLEKFINKDFVLMSEEEGGLESVDLRGNPIYANSVKATRNVINNLIANGIDVKYDEYKPTDINGDNEIDKKDAELLLEYILRPDYVNNSKAIKERQEDMELTFKEENVIVANDAVEILKSLNNK